jgi:hypothetical protein
MYTTERHLYRIYKPPDEQLNNKHNLWTLQVLRLPFTKEIELVYHSCSLQTLNQCSEHCSQSGVAVGNVKCLIVQSVLA